VNWRLVLWWATAIALATWVALHVTILLLVQVPWPVLPPAIQQAATLYAEPLFRQSWWLFAPNPPAFDRAVYVRGTYRTPGGGASDVGETPWLPLSEPVLRAVQENRLSLRDADLTVLLHGMYSLSEAATLPMGPAARDEMINQLSDPDRQPTALIALERVGSAALASTYPEITFQQVQVRLTLRSLPRFPDRDQPIGEPVVDVAFPPVPFQDLAPWSPT
jgi:hypothetical protein